MPDVRGNRSGKGQPPGVGSTGSALGRGRRHTARQPAWRGLFHRGHRRTCTRSTAARSRRSRRSTAQGDRLRDAPRTTRHRFDPRHATTPPTTRLWPDFSWDDHRVRFATGRTAYWPDGYLQGMSVQQVKAETISGASSRSDTAAAAEPMGRRVRRSCSPPSASKHWPRRAAGSRRRSAGSMGRSAATRHSTTRAAIVSATDVPVSADLENAFADEPARVAETVSLAIETGLAGCSVEDFTGHADAADL